MINNNNIEISTALFLMLIKEKESAAVFSEGAESTNEPNLKSMFRELEQYSRKHHGRLYDALQNKQKDDQQWLYDMLWIEIENHSLYNRLMAYITDSSARQMFQQLREAKMRSITLLQEEIKKRKSK